MTDKTEKFDNIFIYETDDEIFKKFLENFNNINDLAEIIMLCNKVTCKEILYEKIVNILEGKDNIVNSEFNVILFLLNNGNLNLNKRKYIIKNIVNKISTENLQKLIKILRKNF